MADFIDIPIDVTAKQIEDKVNEEIDMVVRKGSLNPVMSGAVANALEIIKISADHLLSESVTSEKIAPKAVSGDKIADEAIDYYHIKDGAIEPTHLDREYVVSGSPSALVISADSLFHNFILTNSSPDRISPYTKICLFAVRTTSGLLYDAGVSGRCVGYYLSATEFVFTALSSLTTYIAAFDETELKSIDNVTDDVIDTAIDDKLAIIKLGILNTYEQIKKQSLVMRKAYLFYTGAVIASQIGDSVFLGVYVKNDHNNGGENHIIKCVDLSSGVRWIIDIDNETSTVDTSYLNVDQTYNPDSENAQSGIAVAEAVANAVVNRLPVAMYWLKNVAFEDVLPMFNEDSFVKNNVRAIIRTSVSACVVFENYISNNPNSGSDNIFQIAKFYRFRGAADDGLISHKERGYNPYESKWTDWKDVPIIGDIDTALDNINKELNGLETLLASI